MSDLSEQLGWERRARELLQRISLADSPTVNEALATTLDAVCHHTGWPVGHALVLDGYNALVSAKLWHLDDPARFARFRELTETSRFSAGVGLPGRVLVSARPAWIRDVMVDDNFPRARLMQDASVHAAFAFPVIVSGGVAAVLEFFAVEVSEPDPPLLEVMGAIGSQLGRLLERARSDEAQRRSELRFRSVADSAHDAIITADADGVVVSWNRAAERMFGWREEEAVGHPLTLIIPERFHQAHLRGIERVRQGGERHAIGRTVELEGRHQDGSEIPLELSLATWTIGDERFFTGILRDIRDRKLNEQRLRDAAQRLAESEKRAIEASGAKTVFLANMSHELRTPLNAILGFAQLLERDASLTPSQRETLDIILRSGEHLLGLINDVLSMAKIESGRLSLAVEDFDLAQMIAELGELFRRRAQARGIAFELVADGLPAAVRGDAGKLRQVLFNLLGNATKFTSDGAITLRAAFRDRRGWFSVEDSGPGIAPDDHARIFEPFEQSPTARLVEGTGLGLAISRDFVRLLGGRLALASATGRTLFSFDIPLESGGTVAHVEPRRVIGLEPGEPERRLLVVDNDADSRLLLMRLLGAVGFSPREAVDGQRALELCDEWRPHLVWMDIRMPVLDGLEATRRLRAREAADSSRPRAVVIALTASAFEHDREKILAAGCDAVLTKPFRESAIFDLLAHHLGARFRHDQAAPPVENAVDAARIARLPAALRDRLREALVDGDEQGARWAVEEMARGDAPLAAELHRMIKHYQFDEILTLLEKERVSRGEIFIVDDNPNNLGLLTSILRDAGYHVRMLNSSRRALQAIPLHPPELLMLDVNMPELDGYELCRALKDDPRTSNVPVIFLSALDEVEDKLKAFTVGGVDYVTKPFHPEEVVARVQTQLSLARLRRALEEQNRLLEARNRQLEESYRANERIFAQVAELLPGTTLDGKYRVDEKIGEGGFAVIYRGLHLALSRPVAVKVLRPDPRPSQLERFRREGISATRVQHPNAVSVLDSGVTSSGVAYLVMELLIGRSLADLLANEGTLPLGRCAGIARAVCAALAESHASGIVHRDVKPGNVFLHDGGAGEIVKVVDFGIATLFGDGMAHDRLTTLGRIIGTPVYMSPEQLLGRRLDDRADVYSVGAMLYEMIAGRLPIIALEETLGATVLACVHQEPTPLSHAAPGVPASVERAIMSTLAKTPSQRPAMADFARALDDAILGQEDFRAPPPTASELAATVDVKED